MKYFCIVFEDKRENANGIHVETKIPKGVKGLFSTELTLNQVINLQREKEVNEVLDQAIKAGQA